MKIDLIENCRDWHRFWSVRLMAAIAVLQTAFYFVPWDFILQMLSWLPPETRAMFPQELIGIVTLVLAAGAILARLMPQKKLDERKG